MSDEVETMAYVKLREEDVPWHGLGKPIGHLMTSAEAELEAGIAWKVVQRNVAFIDEVEDLTAEPEEFILPDGSHFFQRPNRVDHIPIPGKLVNIRETDRRVLGFVSERYKIVQNSEAFSFTDHLIGGDVKYETAGSLSNGERVWILAKLPEVKILGDETIPYLVFTNSFNGDTGVRVALTPIRVVCANTLALGLEHSARIWSANHTGNIEEKLAEAHRTLEMANKYLSEMPVMAQDLLEVNLYVDEVKAMFEKLLPIFPDDGPKAVANRMLERDILFHKYQDTPNLEKFKGTGWGVYNAISDFVTHPAFIFNRPGQKERRFMALADGHELLEKAQQLIVPSKKVQVRYRLRQKSGNGKI